MRIKKYLTGLTVVLFIFPVSAFPEEKGFTLKWKVDKGVTAYRMTGTDISRDGSKDQLLDDKTRLVMPSKTSMTILLKQFDEDEITVNFYVDNIKFSDTAQNTESSGDASDLQKMADNLTGKLAIIGRISSSGPVTSFWLAESQENLVAIFFELPGRPVKPGDSWDLHVNMISFDPEFRCKEASKKSRVTFESVEYDVNRDVIAVLSYDVHEKVKGLSRMGDVDCEMSYRGTGKFNITRGEWKSVSMTAVVFATGGFMNTDQKQHIEIVKAESVPSAYKVEE